MPGIARQGLDAAGGTQLAGGQATVYANGARIVVLGDPVAGHGDAPHAAPVMATASATVFAGGITLCRAGDTASCGHASSGSSDVFAGEPANRRAQTDREKCYDATSVWL